MSGVLNSVMQDHGVFSIGLDDAGIIHIVVKEGEPVTALMLEDVLAEHKDLAPGRHSPILYHVTPRPPFDPDILSFIQQGDVRAHVGAVAGLVSSATMRAAANVFIGFMDPPFPIRLFESRGPAMDWLQKFRNQ